MATFETEFLFVYGTLMSGVDNQWSLRLWRACGQPSEAKVPGRLYTLGGYPGMKDPLDGEAAWVHGQLAQLPDSPALLADLDAYEGDEFVRLRRTATLRDGRIVPVQVYMYQPEVDENQRIWSGRFTFAQ
ncbi:gamma-glutamylcyclotransferase family protein [Paludibaculum fermentans]|uniref:Gamma-glutamylcyclotransferase n=1 Tax=Paludibaculum fermentans TaxID=1473598 RepID=A0A7S7NTE0_PALFE|nr:gamma-glutamylcyclotransferase family protein [Paludibaculum fermentans]QOY89476.1 gamma-glutamylcyclotransferase [Paludibaculum fermentans]